MTTTEEPAENIVWQRPPTAGQRSLAELLGAICAIDGVVAVAMWSEDGEIVQAMPMCALSGTPPSWWPKAKDELEMLEWLLVFIKDQKRRQNAQSN